MSFIVDQIRRIDTQLDRLPVAHQTPSIRAVEARSPTPLRQPQLQNLAHLLRTLTVPTTHSLLPPSRLTSILTSSSLLRPTYSFSREQEEEEEEEETPPHLPTASTDSLILSLQWRLLAKTTAQAYGHVLHALLTQTLALRSHETFWADLSSAPAGEAWYWWVALGPGRWWVWAQKLGWDGVKEWVISVWKGGWVKGRGRWSVRRVTRRVKEEMRSLGVGPVAQVRIEAEKRARVLRARREVCANALGVLLGEGLAAEEEEDLNELMGSGEVWEVNGDERTMGAEAEAGINGSDVESLNSQEEDHSSQPLSPLGPEDGNAAARQEKWIRAATKSIAYMSAVLEATRDPQPSAAEDFDDDVTAAARHDAFYPHHAIPRQQGMHPSGSTTSPGTRGVVGGDGSHDDLGLSPEDVAQRLNALLLGDLPSHAASFDAFVVSTGRPRALTRYWIPASAIILSSGTIYQFLRGRREQIVSAIRNFGVTVRDFFLNWVVEPSKRVVATIRHDEGSEVAIMSRRSLEGDRESLERMVVEFAKDNGTMGEGEVDNLRAAVREGDLTPVLKAYERDLRRPFLGAVKGDLIRAVLIQVQKTKVDVEVAMGGIDSLLKSQELVFGFVGLTPGLLVTVAVFRWIFSTVGSRKGMRLGRKKGQMLGILCNIDRVLTAAQPNSSDVLYYKDYGLLLCEAHVLRQIATRTMPSKVLREFLVDVDELTDIKTGASRQKRVVERMRWAYGKWF